MIRAWTLLAAVLLAVLLCGLPALEASAQGANATGVSVGEPGAEPSPTAEDAEAVDPAAAFQEALNQTRRQSGVDLDNPISIGMHAAGAFSGMMGQTQGVTNDDVLFAPSAPNAAPGAAGAGTPSDEQGISATLSILLLLTVLTMVPAILVMCTSFTRIIVVLALLRQALGTQQLPPSQVITGLALFLTLLVMAPTLNALNDQVITPLNAGEINETQAWENAKRPLRHFMFQQIDRAGNWGSVYTIMEWREPGVTAEKTNLKREDVDMLTLVPAFMISELKVAFLMGFRLYLPFLVIDMVVSSVLISMGMLMLPPVMISLPFKLLLFVLVDGWNLLVANLLTSFDMSPMPAPG
ncbi:MAG: flagellar type III secretion system pore protein FliP [Planctomycetota bacterium]